VLRQEGSHVRLGKDLGRTSVPMHGTRDVKSGTLASIDRQTDLKFHK
jgi:predicted RNA binding protein YcfA (HicA-like mRNA interferase family)